MEVLSLEEGVYSVDALKNLTLLSDSDFRPDLKSSLRMAVRPFVIRFKNEIVLLDCGLGIHNNGDFLVTFLLEQQGIKPDQVTKILLSHLHKDHVEGLGYFLNGSFTTHFQNATIYVSQQELDYSLSQKGNASFNDHLVEEVAKLPNLKFVSAERGNITPEIYFEVVGGHTPYHLAFWLSENQRIIFYGGDNLPQAHYLDYPVAYKTDYDGKKAMELRRQWQKEAKKNHWNILLYHDLKLATVTY